MSRPGGMLSALRNPLFARFYLAQAASQFGDAIAWIALALVAVELEGADRAPAIVAIALTLRVAAYVALGPVAGVIADRVDRRTLLAACHLGRAVIVAAMVVVTAPWQVYVLILLLNVLTALFTPANQATVPMIAGREHARSAFALSAATTEILGIVGPGLAGVLAIWVGGRQLFLVIAVAFLVAALLVAALGQLRTNHVDDSTAMRGIADGTRRLWGDRPIRFAVLMELVAAVSGALILTATVGRVQGGLALSEAHFGWAMAVYGVGATLASVAVAHFRGVSLTRWIAVGALLTTLAVMPADLAPYGALLGLWAMAGVGQNWVNLPAETLIAERTDEAAQGRVYGAHFAWSHLWWGLTYPLAAVLTTVVPQWAFLSGGAIGLVVLVVAALAHRPRGGRTAPPPGQRAAGRDEGAEMVGYR